MERRHRLDVLDAAAPRAIPELEALQVICWLTLIAPLATLLGAQRVRPVLRAVAVAAVGVAAVDVLRADAAPLYVDASVTASFAILWILIETWRAPGVPHATWARFGMCAAAVLVANVVIASRAAADPGVAAAGSAYARRSWLRCRRCSPSFAAEPRCSKCACSSRATRHRRSSLHSFGRGGRSSDSDGVEVRPSDAPLCAILPLP